MSLELVGILKMGEKGEKEKAVAVLSCFEKKSNIPQSGNIKSLRTLESFGKEVWSLQLLRKALPFRGGCVIPITVPCTPCT